MFYETFKDLCKIKNVKPTHVVQQLGLSSANMSNWKNGRKPKTDILNNIADYFGVTVDYLLGKEKTSAENGEGNTNTYKVFAMGGTPGMRTITTDSEQLDKMAQLLELVGELPSEKIDMLIKMAESIK